jgi:predicted transcriptional regulator
MEIPFTPELEAKLDQVASETGRGADQLVVELVTSYFDHQEWFKREVEKGIASLNREEFITHEEVGRQMEHLLSS